MSETSTEDARDNFEKEWRTYLAVKQLRRRRMWKHAAIVFAVTLSAALLGNWLVS